MLDRLADCEDVDFGFERFGLGIAIRKAARAGNEEVVKLLLKRGANREVRDTCDRRSLDIGKLNHHADCENVLSPGKQVSSN